MSSTDVVTVKKLINDPESYLLPKGLRGSGRAHADLVRVDLEQRLSSSGAGDAPAGR